jgi:hypothetical protein
MIDKSADKIMPETCINAIFCGFSGVLRSIQKAFNSYMWFALYRESGWKQQNHSGFQNHILKLFALGSGMMKNGQLAFGTRRRLLTHGLNSRLVRREKALHCTWKLRKD